MKKCIMTITPECQAVMMTSLSLLQMDLLIHGDHRGAEAMHEIIKEIEQATEIVEVEDEKSR